MLFRSLRANMVRVDADFSATPFKAKISNAEQLRVHTMLVIGGRDMEAGAVSVRLTGSPLLCSCSNRSLQKVHDRL